ncbi:hypothetical protein SRDD_27150 [Serratia sp. DD3]|nr:hypothetical protein SRDD_27150 [Serratia sp. DD3]
MSYRGKWILISVATSLVFWVAVYQVFIAG